MSVPAFLRRFPYIERSNGWGIPCPDSHASSGYAVIVRPDATLGRWRFECIEAKSGDACAYESALILLLGIDANDLLLLNTGVDGDGRAADGPVFVDLREIEERDVDWIDRPFLPAGELVTNNADGDVGKGLLSVHWASRISRGEYGDESHVDHEVKLALRPLMRLAHSTGCAILGNGHLTKDRSGGARRAASGSTAFTNTPRVGLAMAYDDEDTDLRVLEVVKSNLGPKGVGRNYRVQTLDVEGLDDPVPFLVAEGAAMKAVDDLLAEQRKGKRVPAELTQALVLAQLATGEQSREHLNQVAAEKLGASPDALYKSGIDPLRKAGRIKARKDGMTGGWYYRLSLEEIVG